jgi:hypothetical protein
MSVRHVPVPYKVPSALQLTPETRKAAIRKVGARLKLMRWLTIPINALPVVPEWGMALLPTRPNAVWKWRLQGGDIYCSNPLGWIGFWGGMWSPDWSQN